MVMENFNNNDQINIFKFINENEFSPKTGNNTSPGKYGDLELYLMGMIDENELLTRKQAEYNELLNRDIISRDEYNNRINNNEIVRIYNNVISYEHIDERYWSGIPQSYSLEEIVNKYQDIRGNKKDYQGIAVIINSFDNVNNDLIQQYNESLRYFSSTENNTNPYNFHTATEGRGTFSFTNLSENINFTSDVRGIELIKLLEMEIFINMVIMNQH